MSNMMNACLAGLAILVLVTVAVSLGGVVGAILAMMTGFPMSVLCVMGHRLDRLDRDRNHVDTF